MPPGTPLVAININKHGSVRSVRGCADELKEPVFTYVAAGEKRKKEKSGGKKLLRLFKAILFETSLVSFRLCFFFFLFNFVVFHC